MINMINKISSKLLMLLVLLVAQVSVAFAQVKITMDDLDIYAGEEQTVAVSMENAGEEKLIALQFELTLPTGLTIEGTDKEGSEALQRIHFVQCQRNWNKTGNVYTVVIASSNNTAFKTNAGKLFNLKVKAAAGYLGAGTIEIAGVEGSDTNREPVAGEGGTAASIAATFGAETTAFETYPTQEFEVNITLDNSTVFRDFQFNLTLPKGLELVEGEDGFFGYTDRIPADAALAPQLNGDYYKVACVSPSAGLVDDGKGKFFSFKVKATTALAAEDSIVLNNFVISDRNANAYELDDEIVVKVTNLNEPAKIEADSVVAALQAEYDSTMVKIAADCKDVAESEAVVAEADSVQKLITDLQAAVDAAYAAGTLSELDNAEAVKGIADATSKMLENATAAQKAFDEAVAANAAQYAADTLAVDAAQAALDAVKAEIEGYDESVKAAVADAIAAAQAAVDAAQAAADKSFAAGTSVADAAANAELVAAANAAAEKLAADAAAAQKEFEDSQVDPNMPVAPVLTNTTALVTDGSVAQYLYNVEAKAFLVGANDWGTRASFSATTGYPVKMTLNEDGATYTFADQLPNGNWNSLDCQGVDNIWVDGAGRGGDKMWTVAVAEDGSFTIANNNVPNGNLSAVPSKNDTRLYISDAEEAQDVWVAVSEEEYKNFIEEYNQYLAELDYYNKQNYKVGDDVIALAPATWNGQSGNYGGLANPAAERYNGAGSEPEGDVLTQTVEGLKNGMYEVTMGLAVSYTSGRGFECPVGEGLSVGFVNDQETGLTVVDRGWVGEGEQTTVKLTAAVVDGTLKYGIKNLAPSGNWYVANVLSIVYVSDKVLSDLTAEDYYRWTAADATGEQERVEPTTLALGTSTGLVYGDGNVYFLNYADLSDAETLVAVATEGEPRFLFNRVEDQGYVNAELPRDAAKYETVVDNGDGSKTYTVNIAAIVEEFGFAHLHAIKGANWANTTLTSLQVGKVVPQPKESWYTKGGFTIVAHDFVEGVKNEFVEPRYVEGTTGDDYIEVTSCDNPAQEWDSQIFITLNDELAVGDKVSFSMLVRGTAEGVMSTQTHSAPGSYVGGLWPDINVTTEWTKYENVYTVSNAAAKTLVFNLAKATTANNFQFDEMTISIEKAPQFEWVDIIKNGDMEGYDMTCFFETEQGVGGPYIASATAGAGKDGSAAVEIQSADAPAQDWDTQFFIRLPYVLPAGTHFLVEFDYKADKEGQADTQSHGEPGSYKHYACAGSPNFTTEWQTYKQEGTVANEADGMYTIAFNLAKNKVATKFVIDNVKFFVQDNVLPELTASPVIEMPALTFTDLNSVKEMEVSFTSEVGAFYEGFKSDVDMAEILSALEVESLDALDIYAVMPDNSLDANYKLGETDGWRDAEGAWQFWGENARFYVKADFTKESEQIYEVGGMDGQTTEPAEYETKYVFVKGKDAVVLTVKLSYPVPDAIEGVDAANAANGKYMEDGKIVIIKNGQKYSINGSIIK